MNRLVPQPFIGCPLHAILDGASRMQAVRIEAAGRIQAVEDDDLALAWRHLELPKPKHVLRTTTRRRSR